MTAGHGRDYATYHYAVQEVWQGGDPYVTAALDQRARAEGTRATVFPYFYPPPFLLTMAWATPLSLADGYRTADLLPPDGDGAGLTVVGTRDMTAAVVERLGAPVGAVS